jgi:hypothetical protein
VGSDRSENLAERHPELNHREKIAINEELSQFFSRIEY